jgi:uncharacterized protein (TIGR02246 family)
MDAQAAERDIRAVIDRWLEAVARKDSAAIGQLYAPDGRFLFPNAPIAEGREAIAQVWQKVLGLPEVALRFGPTLIDVASSGDMAYEIGTYTLSFSGEAGRVEDRGKYVVAWKKSGEGWQAVADILNSDLPAPG